MRNVLIVDDSDVDRMMIESLLSKRGFVCIVAENGIQALEKLREWSIDVVLTDLNMPHMDGLELVKAVRRDYPRIPVILTTGVGSEETAAEALHAGASSYIPKHKLADMLFPSVKRLLDIMDDSVEPSRLDYGLLGSRLDFEFGNEPERIRTLVEFIEKTLRFVSPLDRNDRLRVSMAVDQGLHNAMYRGNLEIDSEYKVPAIDSVRDQQLAELIDSRLHAEPFSSRKIRVVLEFKRDRFGIRIRDGGPGFDIQKLATSENFDARGSVLMHAFMDKVEYNETGNDVQLYFYYNREPAAEPTVKSQPRVPPTIHKVPELTCLNTGMVVELGNKKTVVGCRESCHIRLASDHAVAPLHCMFVPEGQSWSLVQISPQCSTMINMNPISGRATLKDGDLITVGNYEFEFNFVSKK